MVGSSANKNAQLFRPLWFSKDFENVWNLSFYFPSRQSRLLPNIRNVYLKHELCCRFSVSIYLRYCWPLNIFMGKVLSTETSNQKTFYSTSMVCIVSKTWSLYVYSSSQRYKLFGFSVTLIEVDVSALSCPHCAIESIRISNHVSFPPMKACIWFHS